MSTGRRSLTDRIGQARAARFVDLPVRDLDGVHVRYGAVGADVLERTRKRHSKKKDGLLLASCEVLVAGCLGVWEEVDGEGVSPVEGYDGVVDLKTHEVEGTLPRFGDEEFAALMGATSASGTATALYVTDLDLIKTADAVLEHSGLSGDDLLEDAGN